MDHGGESWVGSFLRISCDPAMRRSRGFHFIRTNVFQEEVAREKVRQAMTVGIHRLKTFRPGYLDGSGTLVGVGIDGKLIETVIPMFLDRDRGSVNHKRFVAMSEVLSDFDRHAYDVRH